jgi:hypothetical protein
MQQMTSELVGSLSLAVAAVLVVAMLCASALIAWRGWLKIKRLQLQASSPGVGGPARDDGGEGSEETGVLIELAAMKERLRRLEAIANGVEL